MRKRDMIVEVREVNVKRREAEAPEVNEHLRLRLGAASRGGSLDGHAGHEAGT